MATTIADYKAMLTHPIEHVCAELGCGRTTVFKLIDARELDSVKVGRRRMVTDSSLRAFISRQLGAGAVDASC
jgi:excisionase family DNA binding protein